MALAQENPNRRRHTVPVNPSSTLSQALRPAVATWLCLIALLAVTCGAAYLDLGPGRLAVGLGVALLKAALVGWFFMRLGNASRLLRAVFAIAIVTAALLFGLSATDLLVRPQGVAPMQAPQQLSPILFKSGPPHAS